MEQVKVNPENLGSQEPGGSGDEKLLAGKYKSEEELQKGLVELLQKQNEGKTLEEIYKSFESNLGKPPESKPEPPQEPPEQKPQSGGLNFDDFVKEFQEKGALSEDSYKALSNAGISKEVVDAYIAGQQALAERQTQAIYSKVGGEQNYAAMIEWASKNLSESEIKAYNDAISTGTPEQVSFAVEGLYARYSRSVSSPPKNLIHGESGPSTGQFYSSIAQLQADMADPRYKTDPAFRKMVEQKLANSNIL